VAKLDIQFWEDKFLLSDMNRQNISKAFTEEELKIVVFGSDAFGAPGSDGFSFLFYQHFFELSNLTCYYCYNTFTQTL
jgi:hypothetical protein